VRAPDYAEVLIGWRVWCVAETSRGLRLCSVIHDAWWSPAAPLVARCDVDAAHGPPVVECTCGIYAARAPDDVTTYLRGRDEPGTVARVLGRVLLWGTVVEHERGWRASHAAPLDFFVRDAELRRELAAYA
jgi:hypothetical protein